MGYRSDVKMVIKGPKDDMLDAWANYRFKHPYQAVETRDPCLTDMSITMDHSNEVTICFYAEQWKWYEGYEDIERIESVWRFFKAKSEDNDLKISGKFVRIGENDDDTEIREFGMGTFDIELGVSRSIYSGDDVDLENDVRSTL